MQYGDGDDGYTDTLGAQRVPKHSLQLEACGEVDEATSALGLGRALARVARVREIITVLQRDLHLLMAELASVEAKTGESPWRVETAYVDRLEGYIAELEHKTILPAGFVLPGATPASAALDLARAVLRRAERRAALLTHSGLSDNPHLLRYLNRVSTVVYLLARYEETVQGVNYDLIEL